MLITVKTCPNLSDKYDEIEIAYQEKGANNKRLKMSEKILGRFCSKQRFISYSGNNAGISQEKDAKSFYHHRDFHAEKRTAAGLVKIQI